MTRDELKQEILKHVDQARAQVLDVYTRQTGASEDQAKEVADLTACATREAVEGLFEKARLASDDRVGFAYMSTASTLLVQIFMELSSCLIESAVASGTMVGVHTFEMGD